VYAIFGGIVWSAYEEFGSQSLLDLAPLVMADRAPLKLLPGEGGEDRTALPDRPGSDRSRATALARGDPPTDLLRELAPAGSSSTGRTGEADTPASIERSAMAPHDPEPAAVADALQTERSGAAAPETRSVDFRAAALLSSATPASPDEAPQSKAAGKWPPAPAFKPLDAAPAVVAEAMLPPVRSKAETSGLDDGPPLPSLKPIVIPSERRPGRSAEQDTPVVAATGRTSLPDALRAFWTNLRILLASGPAPRVIRAGGDDSDHGDARTGMRGDVADARAGGDGRTSDGGGSSAAGGDNGNNSGGSGGSTTGGGAGSGASAGGGKGGGDKGGSKGGGKGSGDKDSGKGGGKGDHDGGGGKGGRGGDDD